MSKMQVWTDRFGSIKALGNECFNIEILDPEEGDQASLMVGERLFIISANSPRGAPFLSITELDDTDCAEAPATLPPTQDIATDGETA